MENNTASLKLEYNYASEAKLTVLLFFKNSATDHEAKHIY